MTSESAAALEGLRDPHGFEWYVVGLLAFVVYAYARTLARGRWPDAVLGLGFWAVEFLWEMANALVLVATDHAALWMLAGKSAYSIYVGLNVEIAFLFAVAPLVLFDLLDAARGSLLVPIGLGLFCVAVECVLNSAGALVWTWWWWNVPFLPLVVLAYCGPFVALGRIRERASPRAKAIGSAAAIAAAAAAHAVLASGLRWIRARVGRGRGPRSGPVNDPSRESGRADEVRLWTGRKFVCPGSCTVGTSASSWSCLVRSVRGARGDP